MRVRERSVAGQILLLQVLTVLLVVAVAVALAYVDARRDQRDSARLRSVDIAETVADAPDVIAALDDPKPSAAIQPFAERVRRDTGTDFVVVMALDRTRLLPPRPRAARPVVHRRPRRGARRAGSFTQEYTGTLGPSMRAVVPVRDDGQVVALVSVGITLERIDRQLERRLLPIVLAAVAVLAIGALGAWLISRRLRRQTHGLGAAEITRMYEYYDSVLHAVREGLLLIDERRTGAAGQRRGRPAAGHAGRRGRATRRPRSGSRSRSPTRCSPERRDPTRSSWSGTGCWSSTRPRRTGRGRPWGRWSRCATTPSCRPSRASSTPCAGSPSRCGHRTTRPRTGCTPWSR